jgi:hypothetical protein
LFCTEMMRESTEKVCMGEGRRNGQASAALALWFDGRGAKKAAASANSDEELPLIGGGFREGNEGVKERESGERKGRRIGAVGALGGEGKGEAVGILCGRSGGG